MKNSVTFDKDTERKNKVIITKQVGASKPKDEIEAKEMIIEDIATATEGLVILVKMANDSGYMDGDKSANLIVNYFTNTFLNKETKK